VVTLTLYDPADSAGDVAVMLVLLTTVYELASVEPNFTLVAPVKFVPVSVTVVPPAVGPEVGLMLVTVGAGTYVYSSDDEVADVPPTVVTVT
jgi:hypothetical protein